MRNIIFIQLFCICILTEVACSQTAADQVIKKEYLSKARNRTITAWSLLGAGVILNGAYLLQVQRELSNMWVKEVPDPQTGLLILGSGAMLASVPFFISASKHKKYAASFALGSQIFQVPDAYALSMVIQPAVILRIGF